MRIITILFCITLFGFNLFSQSEKVKIITLIENNLVEGKKSLKPEHGISLYISTKDKKMLFDLGRTDNFIKNADSLGIDLKEIDFVIISHAHLDHGGGLKHFLKINNKAKIYLHEKCKKEYLYKKHYIGLDRKLFKNYKNRFQFINASMNIDENIALITDFDKKYLVPENKVLMMKEDNEVKKDDFKHEIVLTIKRGNDIFAFTGCSHSGILNMADAVQKRNKKSQIKAILGGFHLSSPGTGKMSESKERVSEMAKNLKKMSIEVIYTGHCTGIEAFNYLKNILKGKIKPFNTGTILEL